MDMEISTDFTSFHQLPVEIIVHILSLDDINHVDIINVAQTCTRLHEICQGNDLWRRKFQQRWPVMVNRYDREKTLMWQAEYQQRHQFGTAVKQLLRQMSPTHYQSDELSSEDFFVFTELSSQHKQALDFLIDELQSVIHDAHPTKNLTEKYYAVKVVRHLQHILLKQQIQEFIKLPVEKQFLEMGATLIAQWCQPAECFTSSDMTEQLDEIAIMVKQRLVETSPQHPLHEADIDHENVQEDMWSCGHCKGILDAINHVLYNKLNYHGNKRDYYQLENSYIDKVLQLRTGIPITLSIVYAAVARRLGVVCKPVGAPSHFLLRWKQRPMGTENTMYVYIDAFNSGKFLELDQLTQVLHVPPDLLNVPNMHNVSPCQVLERMIRNLIAIGREQRRMGDNLLCLRDALELSLLFNPDDIESRLLLVRVNLHLNINLPDAVDSLESVAGEDQSRIGLVANLMVAAQHQMAENKKKDRKKKLKVKKRKNATDAVFSVGLVMRHKRYDYKCVIYSWDKQCAASQDWIVQMGVNTLPRKAKQPFYNVLVEDGTNRYAAEENLEFMESPGAINRQEIGKYFMSFEGTHYVLNAEKAEEYPEDAQHAAKLINEQYGT